MSDVSKINGYDIKDAVARGLVVPTSVPANADLDNATYRTAGVYYVGSNATAATISNIPNAAAGYLFVYTGGVKVQKYITFKGDEYVRYYNDWDSPASWKTWYHVASYNDDVVYDRGTTTKGSIDWHWKKWESGAAECWGVYEFTPNNLQMLVSNWYYQYTPSAELPFTFTTLEVFLCSGRSASSAAIIQPHTEVPATSVTNLVFLITQATNTARKHTISILCKGTWK